MSAVKTATAAAAPTAFAPIADAIKVANDAITSLSVTTETALSAVKTTVDGAAPVAFTPISEAIKAVQDTILSLDTSVVATLTKIQELAKATADAAVSIGSIKITLPPIPPGTFSSLSTEIAAIQQSIESLEGIVTSTLEGITKITESSAKTAFLPIKTAIDDVLFSIESIHTTVLEILEKIAQESSGLAAEAFAPISEAVKTVQDSIELTNKVTADTLDAIAKNIAAQAQAAFSPITDAVLKVQQTIEKTGTVTEATLEQISGASKELTAAGLESIEKLSIATKEYAADMQLVSSATVSGVAAIGGTTKETVAGLNASKGAAESAHTAVSGWMAALIAFYSIETVAHMADDWKNLQAKTEIVSKDAADAREKFQDIVRLAEDTHTQLETVGKLYITLARSLHTSNEEVSGITEAIAKSIQISGATWQEARSTIIQMSQAFSSNRLGGDEFRSMMENAPRLVQAFTNSLNINVGALRTLSKEGALTGDVMKFVMLDSLKKIRAEYDMMPLTIGRAVEFMGTKMEEVTGQFDKAYGATNLLAHGIKGIADNLDTILAVTGAGAIAIALTAGFSGVVSLYGKVTTGLQSIKTAGTEAVASIKAEAQASVDAANSALVASKEKSAAIESEVAATQKEITAAKEAILVQEARISKVKNAGQAFTKAAEDINTATEAEASANEKLLISEQEMERAYDAASLAAQKLAAAEKELQTASMTSSQASKAEAAAKVTTALVEKQSAEAALNAAQQNVTANEKLVASAQSALAVEQQKMDKIVQSGAAYKASSAAIAAAKEREITVTAALNKANETHANILNALVTSEAKVSTAEQELAALTSSASQKDTQAAQAKVANAKLVRDAVIQQLDLTEKQIAANTQEITNIKSTIAAEEAKVNTLKKTGKAYQEASDIIKLQSDKEAQATATLTQLEKAQADALANETQAMRNAANASTEYTQKTSTTKLALANLGGQFKSLLNPMNGMMAAMNVMMGYEFGRQLGEWTTDLAKLAGATETAEWMFQHLHSEQEIMERDDKERQEKANADIQSLSLRTGVAISTMREFNEATAKGALVWDDATKRWEKGDVALDAISNAFDKQDAALQKQEKILTDHVEQVKQDNEITEQRNAVLLQSAANTSSETDKLNALIKTRQEEIAASQKVLDINRQQSALAAKRLADLENEVDGSRRVLEADKAQVAAKVQYQNALNMLATATKNGTTLADAYSRALFKAAQETANQTDQTQKHTQSTRDLIKAYLAQMAQSDQDIAQQVKKMALLKEAAERTAEEAKQVRVNTGVHGIYTDKLQQELDQAKQNAAQRVRDMETSETAILSKKQEIEAAQKDIIAKQSATDATQNLTAASQNLSPSLTSNTAALNNQQNSLQSTQLAQQSLTDAIKNELETAQKLEAIRASGTATEKEVKDAEDAHREAITELKKATEGWNSVQQAQQSETQKSKEESARFDVELINLKETLNVIGINASHLSSDTLQSLHLSFNELKKTVPNDSLYTFYNYLNTSQASTSDLENKLPSLYQRFTEIQKAVPNESIAEFAKWLTQTHFSTQQLQDDLPGLYQKFLNLKGGIDHTSHGSGLSEFNDWLNTVGASANKLSDNDLQNLIGSFSKTKTSVDSLSDSASQAKDKVADIGTGAHTVATLLDDSGKKGATGLDLICTASDQAKSKVADIGTGASAVATLLDDSGKKGATGLDLICTASDQAKSKVADIGTGASAVATLLDDSGKKGAAGMATIGSVLNQITQSAKENTGEISHASVIYGEHNKILKITENGVTAFTDAIDGQKTALTEVTEATDKERFADETAADAIIRLKQKQDDGTNTADKLATTNALLTQQTEALSGAQQTGSADALALQISTYGLQQKQEDLTQATSKYKDVNMSVVDGIATFTGTTEKQNTAFKSQTQATKENTKTKQDNSTETQSNTGDVVQNTSAVAKNANTQKECAQETSLLTNGIKDQHAAAQGLADLLTKILNGAISELSQYSAEAGKAVEKLKNANGSMGNSMEQTTNQINELAKHAAQFAGDPQKIELTNKIEDLRVSITKTAQEQMELSQSTNALFAPFDHLLGAIKNVTLANEKQALAQAETDLASKNLGESLSSLKDKLDEGKIGLGDYSSQLKNLSVTYSNLGDEQLKELRAALKDAKDKTDALAQSAQSALADALKAADDTLGANNKVQEEEIAWAQQKKDLLKQIAEAQTSGNQQAIADLQKAMEIDEQVHQKKMQQLQSEGQQQQANNDIPPPNAGPVKNYAQAVNDASNATSGLAQNTEAATGRYKLLSDAVNHTTETVTKSVPILGGGFSDASAAASSASSSFSYMTDGINTMPSAATNANDGFQNIIKNLHSVTSAASDTSGALANTATQIQKVHDVGEHIASSGLRTVEDHLGKTSDFADSASQSLSKTATQIQKVHDTGDGIASSGLRTVENHLTQTSDAAGGASQSLSEVARNIQGVHNAGDNLGLDKLNSDFNALNHNAAGASTSLDKINADFTTVKDNASAVSSAIDTQIQLYGKLNANQQTELDIRIAAAKAENNSALATDLSNQKAQLEITLLEKQAQAKQHQSEVASQLTEATIKQAEADGTVTEGEKQQIEQAKAAATSLQLDAQAATLSAEQKKQALKSEVQAQYDANVAKDKARYEAIQAAEKARQLDADNAKKAQEAADAAAYQERVKKQTQDIADAAAMLKTQAEQNKKQHDTQVAAQQQEIADQSKAVDAKLQIDQKANANQQKAIDIAITLAQAQGDVAKVTELNNEKTNLEVAALQLAADAKKKQVDLANQAVIAKMADTTATQSDIDALKNSAISLQLDADNANLDVLAKKASTLASSGLSTAQTAGVTSANNFATATSATTKETDAQSLSIENLTKQYQALKQAIDAARHGSGLVAFNEWTGIVADGMDNTLSPSLDNASDGFKTLKESVDHASHGSGMSEFNDWLNTVGENASNLSDSQLNDLQNQFSSFKSALDGASTSDFNTYLQSTNQNASDLLKSGALNQVAKSFSNINTYAQNSGVAFSDFDTYLKASYGDSAYFTSNITEASTTLNGLTSTLKQNNLSLDDFNTYLKDTGQTLNKTDIGRLTTQFRNIGIALNGVSVTTFDSLDKSLDIDTDKMVDFASKIGGIDKSLKAVNSSFDDFNTFLQATGQAATQDNIDQLAESFRVLITTIGEPSAASDFESLATTLKVSSADMGTFASTVEDCVSTLHGSHKSLAEFNKWLSESGVNADQLSQDSLPELIKQFTVVKHATDRASRGSGLSEFNDWLRQVNKSSSELCDNGLQNLYESFGKTKNAADEAVTTNLDAGLKSTGESARGLSENDLSNLCDTLVSFKKDVDNASHGSGLKEFNEHLDTAGKSANNLAVNGLSNLQNQYKALKGSIDATSSAHAKFNNQTSIISHPSVLPANNNQSTTPAMSTPIPTRTINLRINGASLFGDAANVNKFLSALTQAGMTAS